MEIRKVKMVILHRNCSFFSHEAIYVPTAGVKTHTHKTGIVFGNGSSIPNLLRQVFHSQIKIKCLTKM